ncbi:hypothetical protein FQN49_003517 [Arthroderma sp. PD_2]|nr:hypothetical protein FQN49_003517 [Arthroderma sp. PD_2]
MRVCVVNSSYEGADSPFEKYDDFADPSRYIPKSRHEFIMRWVTKANAKAEIDKICEEKFDIYMNYMWGTENDPVAGVEATQYLESKGVPVLAIPSRFLILDKLDLQRAAEKTGLRVPRDTPGKYPKIVKYPNACGSLDVDYGSICHNEDDVKKRVAYLTERNPTLGTLIQDYIVGTECSAVVLEMGSEVVALTPLRYVFPEDTPANEEFLTWHNKFEACETGDIKYALVEDEHQSNIKQAAVDAFKAFEGCGGGCWGRVDMRLEKGTGHVYVIEVNPTATAFYPIGNSLGDDLVVGERFPGRHAAFFDMMLATKQMQLKWNKPQMEHIATFYDNLAPKYNAIHEKSGMPDVLRSLTQFDFSGTVLDVACGTGLFGRLLVDLGVQAEITGIDLSPGMMDSPDIKKYYKQPLRVGPMQELIMGAGEFDHILCMGALYLLDSVNFNATLARMFMLARKSVSIEVTDISQEFIDSTIKGLGSLFVPANHVKLVEEFGVPYGWKLVHKKKQFLFKSVSVDGATDGYVMHFERL